MDEKLTTIDGKPSDYRIACSDYHSDSIAPHKRVRELDHQGAQSGSFQIGSIWSATVVAPRTGGASQSKRTRKTRPWNTSLRAAVVATISIEEPYRESIEFMPKPPYGAFRHKQRSPASRSEAKAGKS